MGASRFVPITNRQHAFAGVSPRVRFCCAASSDGDGTREIDLTAIPALSPDLRVRLTQWLKARSEQRSERFPGHSAHFDRFPPITITVPDGYASDYMGNTWPTHFGFSASPGTYETSLPEVTEEYFEMLDIMEAALDAGRSFTMLEWGAGFARWSSFGVGAARRLGIEDIRIGAVEADPIHLSYVIENMWIMDIPDDRVRLYPYALSGKTGSDLFVIGAPPVATGAAGGDRWFGQALNDMGGYELGTETYGGRPVQQNPNGFKAIEIMVEPASKVLADYDYVDLIDMDLQGAEADVVDESIDLLNSRVRRLHIGTHGTDIERRMRETLSANDWILIRDLPLHAPSSTPFGDVVCVDGVQSWFNPRFPPPGFAG